MRLPEVETKSSFGPTFSACQVKSFQVSSLLLPTLRILNSTDCLLVYDMPGRVRCRLGSGGH